MTDIKEKYRDERRTKIVKEEAEPHARRLDCRRRSRGDDFACRVHQADAVTLYRAQRRGRQREDCHGHQEEDFVETLSRPPRMTPCCSLPTRARSTGSRCTKSPEASRAAKGKSVRSICWLFKDRKVTATLPVKESAPTGLSSWGLSRASSRRRSLSAYSNPRQGGIIALSLDAGDKLIGVDLTDGQREILLGTKQGHHHPFQGRRCAGHGTHGPRCARITLEAGDEVIGMETITPDSTTAILTVTEGGYGKRTPVNEYRVQGTWRRQGIISVKTTERNGAAVGFLQVRDEDEIMLMAAQGKVLRCKVDDIREIGRNTQGVRLLDMDGDEDRVVAVVRLVEREEGCPKRASGLRERRRIQASLTMVMNQQHPPSAGTSAAAVLRNVPGYGRENWRWAFCSALCADLGRYVSQPAGSFHSSL